MHATKWELLCAWCMLCCSVSAYRICAIAYCSKWQWREDDVARKEPTKFYCKCNCHILHSRRKSGIVFLKLSGNPGFGRWSRMCSAALLFVDVVDNGLRSRKKELFHYGVSDVMSTTVKYL